LGSTDCGLAIRLEREAVRKQIVKRVRPMVSAASMHSGWWLLRGVLLAASASCDSHGNAGGGGTGNTAATAQDTARGTAAKPQSAPANVSPCSGQAVLVTFSAESVGDVSPTDTARSLGQLRTLTDRTIAPMRDRVIHVEYSPVIRTVRLSFA
jgi:hypothetical protein